MQYVSQNQTIRSIIAQVKAGQELGAFERDYVVLALNRLLTPEPRWNPELEFTVWLRRRPGEEAEGFDGTLEQLAYEFQLDSIPANPWEFAQVVNEGRAHCGEYVVVEIP